MNISMLNCENVEKLYKNFLSKKRNIPKIQTYLSLVPYYFPAMRPVLSAGET